MRWPYCAVVGLQLLASQITAQSVVPWRILGDIREHRTDVVRRKGPPRLVFSSPPSGKLTRRALRDTQHRASSSAPEGLPHLTRFSPADPFPRCSGMSVTHRLQNPE